MSRLKGEDILKDVDCERRLVQFSYQDGDNTVFMDNESFEQFMINKTDIEQALPFISEALDNIVAVLLDGQLITIELPATVALPIVETAPGIKGATAAARTKPAVLSTGLGSAGTGIYRDRRSHQDQHGHGQVYVARLRYWLISTSSICDSGKKRRAYSR